MYEIIPQENGYGIVGMDGDIIMSRPTQEKAASTAAELNEEYVDLMLHLIPQSIGFDLAGAVEEALTPNLFVMDRETHQEISRQTTGRKRIWSRIMRCFTEKMEFSPQPQKPHSQEEYRKNVGWIPSSERRPLKSISNDERKWASKLREAIA